MTTIETSPRAQEQHQGDGEDRQLAVLAETRDYTRRIHWWIRLFGVVWLTTLGLSALVGAGLGIAAATGNSANEPSPATTNSTSSFPSNTSPYSSRAECMAAPTTDTAECNAWFGTP